MENKRQPGGSSLDHLFGPKDSPSSSSSSTGIFGSIFSTPSTALGRDPGSQVGNGNYGKSDSNSSIRRGEGSGVTGKDKMTSVYQNESVQPCYFSSSIYYGGQENYSPKTKNSESHNMFKKDGGDDDPNGNNSNSASRGNWWQGSLYY